MMMRLIRNLEILIKPLLLFNVCLLSAFPLWAQDCRFLDPPPVYAQMFGFEPKIQSARTLCRYLVPAWGDYLGKHKASYLEGYRRGSQFAFADLDWGSLDPEKLALKLKGVRISRHRDR